ncbi:MAG: hypothetical protein LUE63_00255, partial [Lachnospiraceae bacterium]|nr:hypothetical protein [Lachnospiraceae bacterium]
MSYDTFLVLLMAVSVVTSLVTEAIKKYLTEQGKTYSSNIIAGTVSVVLAIAEGAAYVVMEETAVTAKLIVILVALVLLSWLCAMVGYDKVVQAIQQIKSVATGTTTVVETVSANKEDVMLTLTENGLETYTKAELKAYMDTAGITYTARAT